MGTSFLVTMGLYLFGDHPHAYGDKSFQTIGKYTETGSSPRVWGQGYFSAAFRCVRRIIPTRMGTRQRRRRFHNLGKDHPHAYGDKYKVKRAGFTNAGSSPRVWGQATNFAEAFFKSGIIPTRMGTSSAEMSGRKRV